MMIVMMMMILCGSLYVHIRIFVSRINEFVALELKYFQVL